MIDLQRMINPLGPSPKAIEAIKENICNIHKYTAPLKKFVQKIALINNVKEDQIMISDGADGALTLIAQSIFKGKRVVIPQPCFHRYKDYPSYLDIDYILVSPKDSLFIDENRILQNKGDILLLASPNNPTGFEISEEFLTKALENFESVILDETLLLSLTGKQNLIFKYPNLIIVRSFSKLCGLAGLRVGYVIGSAGNITKIKNVSTPFKVNYLGQVAALSVLSDLNYVTKTKKFIQQERVRLYNTLKNKNILLSKSLCFCLQLSNEQLDALSKKEILIEKDAEFVSSNVPKLLRICISTPENNDCLIEALRTTETAPNNTFGDKNE